MKVKWMTVNRLEKLFKLIKKHRWKKLFSRRDHVYKSACREFYKNLVIEITSTKEVARSSVHGVNIELDGMSFSTILGIPGNLGLCDYIKDVWEESKYCKPLEITRKFLNDHTIMEAGSVSSNALRSFQRMLHFFVIKNLLPRFGKRDTTSFMDWTYMEYLTAMLLINHPRLMIRHMSYVIACHIMSSLMEAVNEEVELQGEQVEEEAQTEGEPEKEAEKFYDVDERFVDNHVPDPAILEAPAIPKAPVSQTHAKPKGKTTSTGVDPSGSLPDNVLLHLQAEMDRALKRNTRFQELYQ
ncbi:hypothetical protein Dimus_028912 [Dionaea muscipula]